jgi:hypothetical protein
MERLRSLRCHSCIATPTPVREIRVQQYPKYRFTRTDMTLIEGRVFWTLFNHIKQLDIAITGHPEQGCIEVDGKVAVIDIPAQLAVGIGLRGEARTR